MGLLNRKKKAQPPSENPSGAMSDQAPDQASSAPDLAPPAPSEASNPAQTASEGPRMGRGSFVKSKLSGLKGRKSKDPQKAKKGKGKPAPSVVMEDEDKALESGDSLGPYPSKIDVKALQGRRYIWVARSFAIGFYVSMALNIFLVSLVVILTPLKKVQPMLIAFNEKQDTLNAIEPLSTQTTSFQLMKEAQARRYVRMREEILPSFQEMAERWGKEVFPLTGELEYRRFQSQSSALLKQFQDRQAVRLIRILSLENLSKNDIKIEFELRDYNTRVVPAFDDTADLIQSERWQAYLRVIFSPENVKLGGKYKNPLGFSVIEYRRTRSN